MVYDIEGDVEAQRGNVVFSEFGDDVSLTFNPSPKSTKSKVNK